MKFGKSILKVRIHSKIEYVQWIYESTQSDAPLNTILEVMIEIIIKKTS